MPWKNSKQRAACYAQKAANPDSKWDCESYGKDTTKKKKKKKFKRTPKT